ncbi:MAG: hypothetical protein WB715_00895 [Roseiarcus sp.]|uniref:hypothetical protein n=1 Tax=Roseiarcus sp. TaxID=1969460 RepID=UPI003C409288
MAGGAETSTSQRGTPSLYLPRTPGRQASMLPRKFHAARLHGAMTEHAYRSPRRVFNGSFAPNIAVLLMVAESRKRSFGPHVGSTAAKAFFRSGVDAAHVSFAQTPAIRRRLGERAKSTEVV